MLYLENQDPIAEKCLESLMRQSYKDIELIIIDDSVSKEAGIAFGDEKYSSMNMTVLKHAEKMGFYRSIAEGLEAAGGDCVSIMDNKVMLSIDFYRILYNKLVETDSDIAVSDVGKYTDSKKFYYNLDTLRFTDLEPEKYSIGEIFGTEGFAAGIYSLHNKLFKTALLKKAFSERPNADDSTIIYKLFFIMNIFANAKRVCNAHNVIAFYDDTFYPVDVGVNIKKEAAGFERFREHFAGNEVTGERIVTFALSFYLSFFFFHKCYYEKMIKDLIKGTLGMPSADIDLSYKKMFRIFTLVTDFSESYTLYENIKSFICDPKVKYFGFDVFDTLVVRPFFEPSDLFVCLNKKFSEFITDDACIEFSLIRREGEWACRQQYNVLRPCNEDVSLQEIYDFISKEYGFDKSITDAVMQYEMELELRFIQPRNIGREFFELAQYMGKTVFIASDMYLPEEHIEKMLRKCGYDNYKLYLSNTLGISKYSGNLYKHILKDLSIDPSSEGVGFIGDNFEVDVKNSQKNGMTGFHLPKTVEIFMNGNLAIYSGEYFRRLISPDGGIIDLGTVFKFLGIRSMYALAANKMFDNPYISVNRTSDFNSDLRFIGYFICGMFLYGESKWIFDRSEAEEKKTVHFVSRDGYYFKQAYDIISRKIKGYTNSNYLYISRKAIVPLYMQDKHCILEAYTPTHAVRQTPESIIRTMKPILTEDILENAEELCNKNGFPYRKRLSTQHQYLCFAAFFSEKMYNKEAYQKYAEKVKPYFEEQIHRDDVLFDVGYSGRGEKILSKLLGFPVNSMYFHTHEPLALTRKKKMGFEIETFYSFKPVSAFVTREQIFTPNAPSCVGFKFDNGKCSPVFDDNNKESYIGTYLVSIIQKYAVEFVKDFMDIFGDFDEVITINNFDSCLPFEYYLHYSKDFDRQLFSFVDFEDDFGTNQILNVKEYWDDESREFGCSTHFAPPVQQAVNAPGENNYNMISLETYDMGLQKIYNSWTWKAGKVVMAVPSAIKRLVIKKKEK